MRWRSAALYLGSSQIYSAHAWRWVIIRIREVPRKRASEPAPTGTAAVDKKGTEDTTMRDEKQDNEFHIVVSFQMLIHGASTMLIIL